MLSTFFVGHSFARQWPRGFESRGGSQSEGDRELGIVTPRLELWNNLLFFVGPGY